MAPGGGVWDSSFLYTVGRTSPLRVDWGEVLGTRLKCRSNLLTAPSVRITQYPTVSFYWGRLERSLPPKAGARYKFAALTHALPPTVGRTLSST